jgi:hypothetical protein
MWSEQQQNSLFKLLITARNDESEVIVKVINLLADMTQSDKKKVLSEMLVTSPDILVTSSVNERKH